MLFDIIIPTYNNLEELKCCLYGLERQTIKDFHVWICVDGSTDGTVEWLQQVSLPFAFTYLQHPDKKNHRWSKTRNLALPFLSASFVVMLDSDLVPACNLLESHQMVTEKGQISLGRNIFSDTENCWTRYAMNRGKGRFSDGSSIGFQYLESNNVAMPTVYLKGVNGFDTFFTVYAGEDTELAYRIHCKYRVDTIYNASAIATGRLEKTLIFALKQREEFAAKNLVYIRKKHPKYDEIFHVQFLESRKAHVFYLLFLLTEGFIKRVLIIFPEKIQNKLIHFLVFGVTYRGFYRKQKG